MKLSSSTHPTLKLWSNLPQAACSLDHYPTLLLHHGKTVPIRPSKAHLDTISTAIKTRIRLKKNNCYIEVSTLHGFSASPACVIDWVFWTVMIAVTPQESLGRWSRSCTARSLLPTLHCLFTGCFVQHAVQYVACEQKKRYISQILCRLY